MSNQSHKFQTITDTISKQLVPFRSHQSEVMKGFGELARNATKDGAIDTKTKEFIALALGVASRCDPCIGFHAKALVNLGATVQEIEEVLAMTVYMGGGPSLMYTANALDAFNEFSNLNSAKVSP